MKTVIWKPAFGIRDAGEEIARTHFTYDGLPVVIPSDEFNTMDSFRLQVVLPGPSKNPSIALRRKQVDGPALRR